MKQRIRVLGIALAFVAALRCVAGVETPPSTGGCSRDVDCEAGTYCGAAGSCTRDCRLDVDCRGGQACNARGRCAAVTADAGPGSSDAGLSRSDAQAPPIDAGPALVDAPAPDHVGPTDTAPVVDAPPRDAVSPDAPEAGGASDESSENPFATDPNYESVLELGGADARRLAYGSDLGSYRGVVARSNYVGSCEPSPSCFFSAGAPRTRGAHGWQYKCVEYVVRFYAEALGYRGLVGSGDARQYWHGPLTAAARALERYANGGTVAPQPDDMIIFEGRPYGHIAIVRAVGADSVRIIQQNWFHNAGDGDHRLTLSTAGGRYTVGALGSGGAYPVLGWRRAPGSTMGCPTPGCSGYGTCTAGACLCNTGYVGANCERCAAGYDGFPTCRAVAVDPCVGRTCNGHGACAADLCRCNPGFEGVECERCAPGFINYPTCARDLCVGNACSAHGSCVPATGACSCAVGFAGDRCERCAPGFISYPTCAVDPCAGVNCSGRGNCSAGSCRCETGYAGSRCDACAAGYMPQGSACVVDVCAGINCNGHGACSGGSCQCTARYDGARCDRCASGYVSYPSCDPAPPPETCNGRDDDGNGVVDDPYSCWRAIYRFVQDASGARCLGPTTSAPSTCAGYRYEREAFIVAVAASSNAFRAVQCSRRTDHIVVDADGSDRNALQGLGYDCSLELGYIYRGTPGRTLFANACPLWRYRYMVAGGDGAHLFTRGNDAVSAYSCEAPSRGWVVTNDGCFGASAPGCP